MKIAVVGKGSVDGGLANLWENPTPGNVWCGDEEARAVARSSTGWRRPTSSSPPAY